MDEVIALRLWLSESGFSVMGGQAEDLRRARRPIAWQLPLPSLRH
jgi:hypothetical protein